MHPHMAVVGLCQIWHNDFCVSFSSHGARIQQRSLIRNTAAKKRINTHKQSYSLNILKKSPFPNDMS